MIEIHWGEPISLVSPNGEKQRFSTLEKAAYWLRRKWPVADEARQRALMQVQAAMDCLTPPATARMAFVSAARTAGFEMADAADRTGRRLV